MSTPQQSPATDLVGRLRRCIIDGVYGPGVQLRELELAPRFGVSRNSLRLAFRELEHLGLLEHIPNRGVFVRRFSAAEIGDYFCLRSAVESEAARRAIANPGGLKQLQAALTALERLPADAPWHACMDADLALHRQLVQAASSPRLDRVFDGLQAEFLVLLADVRHQYPSPQPALFEQHARLVEALHSGDETIAVSAVRAHLDQSMTECLAQRTPAAVQPSAVDPQPEGQHDGNPPQSTT